MHVVNSMNAFELRNHKSIHYNMNEDNDIPIILPLRVLIMDYYIYS
jgi:hypothetical protein